MKPMTAIEKVRLDQRKHNLRTLNRELWYKALRNLDLADPIDPEDQEAADKEYCRLMRALPTDVLEDILKGHDEGLSVRQPNTIQEILSELADRSLLR